MEARGRNPGHSVDLRRDQKVKTSAPDQAAKALAFRALHERDRAFVIPNPWDIGTARILAHLGFEALATTSAGFAFSLGRTDNTVTRAEMMAHLGAIATATGPPGKRRSRERLR